MGDKVQWLKEMRSNPNRRNLDFWCEFHNDHGHRASHCRLLQGEVELLLKQGLLTELFSEKGKQAYMKNRQEPPKPPSPKRTVNVIKGREKVNGVAYTAARKMTKLTITQGKRTRQTLEDGNLTFDDVDADRLMVPHNDALGIQQIWGDQQTSSRINSVIQPSQKDTSANQKDAGASVKDAVNHISTESVSK
nr:uncharacterized protein LOC104095579 [Nicotiana tomentosiformis]